EMTWKCDLPISLRIRSASNSQNADSSLRLNDNHFSCQDVLQSVLKRDVKSQTSAHQQDYGNGHGYTKRNLQGFWVVERDGRRSRMQRKEGQQQSRDIAHGLHETLLVDHQCHSHKSSHQHSPCEHG